MSDEGDVRERQRNKRHKECGGRGQDFKCQEASSIRWLLSRHRKGVSPVDGGRVRSRERASAQALRRDPQGGECGWESSRGRVGSGDVTRRRA